MKYAYNGCGNRDCCAIMAPQMRTLSFQRKIYNPKNYLQVARNKMEGYLKGKFTAGPTSIVTFHG
jgi:hypothetical protein